MMIRSLCNSCMQPFEISVEVAEVSLVKEITDDAGLFCPCPRLCGGKINLVGDATIEEMSKDRRLKDPMRISGRELYRAVNGLGLPDEFPNSTEVISSFIQGGVEEVDIEEFQGKFFIHELKLKNGSVLHLGAGLKGAQVLKITRGSHGR